VIFSDGCNNTSAVIDPETFAARMGARTVPVHTVGAGSETVATNLRALSVSSLGCPQTTGAFHRLAIQPVVEAIGLQGQTVRLTCRFGDTELPAQTRTISQPQARETFEFVHVPLDTGFRRLTVKAEVVGQAPRGLAGTFAADQLVHVVDRELRVLYVEGKFRYETKAIAHALASLERISLHRRVILQPLRPGQTPPLGETIEDWLRYHAILLGDAPAWQFTPANTRSSSGSSASMARVCA
jgi:hypothetical protein